MERKYLFQWKVIEESKHLATSEKLHKEEEWSSTKGEGNSIHGQSTILG